MASQQVERWRSLVARYFPPDQVENALRVIDAESGGNPNAENVATPAREQSYGLFQINTNVHRLTPEQASDPETNVRYAAGLWRQNGWGNDWVNASRSLGLDGGGTGGGAVDDDQALAEIEALLGGDEEVDSASTGDFQSALEGIQAQIQAKQAELATLDPNSGAYFQANMQIDGLIRQFNALKTVYQSLVTGEARKREAEAKRTFEKEQTEAGQTFQKQQAEDTRGFQSTQADLDRAMQLTVSQLTNDVVRGRLTLDQAQAKFNRSLQQRDLAGSLLGRANEQVLAGSRWALPAGAGVFPGYAVGGPADQLSKLLGAKFQPPVPTDIPFDPRGDALRALAGAYNWAPEPTGVSGAGAGAGGGGRQFPAPDQNEWWAKGWSPSSSVPTGFGAGTGLPVPGWDPSSSVPTGFGGPAPAASWWQRGPTPEIVEPGAAQPTTLPYEQGGPGFGGGLPQPQPQFGRTVTNPNLGQRTTVRDAIGEATIRAGRRPGGYTLRNFIEELFSPSSQGVG